MRVLELITDPNGSLSHTKLWSNIANCIASLAFILSVYGHGLTPELLIAYVGVVGLQRVASKYIDSKGESNVTIAN
jgi:hypothetical protein